MVHYQCPISCILQLPETKQYTASNEVEGLQNHQTVVSRKYSSPGMIIILKNVQRLFIDSNNFACKFMHYF